MSQDNMIPHLLDLCRRSERTGLWTYSGFLTPAEQEDFLRSPESACFSFRFEGGYALAERKILIAGDEAQTGYPADPPIRVIEVRPLSLKFAEDLTHRDYLGAILGLGIERALTGDILIREKTAWFFCLDSAADFLVSSLTQVRRTSVSAAPASPDLPALQPRYEPLRLNVASERLDAVVAAFTGLSRGQAVSLFASEKVFVNSRMTPDKSFRLKEGDILSVRGFGKAVYDGLERETKKGRLWVSLRKLV